MKKYLFLIIFGLIAASCFLACFNGAEKTGSAAGAPAQVEVPADVPTEGVPSEYALNVVRQFVEKQTDTLSASSSKDTSDYDIGTFFGPMNYHVDLFADSLSGSTGATYFLQNSLEFSGNDWYNVTTGAIDGVSTKARLSGTILRGRLRLRTITPTSTQSTALRTVAFLTEDNP